MIYKLFSPQQRQKQKQKIYYIAIFVGTSHTHAHTNTMLFDCKHWPLLPIFLIVYKKLNILFLCLQQK